MRLNGQSRQTWVLLLALVCAILGTGTIPVAAQSGLIVFSDGRSGDEIDVAVSKFVTVGTATDVGRVVVGDADIASVVVTSARSLYILGNAPGTTNVVVFDQRGEMVGMFDVEVGADIADLRLAIRQAVPDAKVEVQSVNGRIRLAGSVPDGPSVQSILDIAEQYGADDVINALTVKSTQQVMLEVRFVEASRNAARELGIGLAVRSSGDTSGRGLVTGRGLPGGTTPFATLLTQILDTGITADLLLDALEQKGLARRLAEPNLVALSGNTASFLAGGEVPIPVAENEDTITVTYKEYGVRLNFTPVVLDNGLINLKLEPEVSQIDPTTTVRTGSIEVPAFISRRATTTIELRDGQSFAMAGLLQTVHTKEQEQVPYLGQVPVLGALFRSSSYQKQETDLVIIVTPRLVRPTDPGVRLKTPLDGARPSNDPEFLLLGMLEVNDDMLRRFASGDGIIGPYGHIIELQTEADGVYKK